MLGATALVETRVWPSWAGAQAQARKCSSAKKRFSVTSSGKIKRKHAFKSHILTKKTTKQKRRLTNTGLVDKSDLKNVKQQLSMK